MEIRQLEAFAAVCSAGNVTAAGRLLDRSQSVVSRQVQDLEQELGFTLFNRTRPHVTLTAEGHRFYDEARNVLATLQHLEDRSREIARGDARPLYVACSHALGASLAAAVLGRLEATTPVFENKLCLDTMPSSQAVQMVTSGNADLGLISMPIDLGRCHLQWSGQAPCVIALPENHPLAKHEVIPLDELGDQTVITMSNSTRLRHRLATALLGHRGDAAPRRHIETTSNLTALMLVKAKVGVALMDPFTALCLKPRGVVYRPADRHLPYVIGVITHPDRVLTDEAQRFIGALWDFASAEVPRFVRGDPSGLPQALDPFEEERAKSIPV
ncbi:LysR family transcriptional regulator [Parapusillimonas sp. JC17]|uniref:LysR family transcriptional regulator n=1 Tax=Parapusillimonas sp. JC17 TaxID=3445768 RepID=UPI003F9F730E